MKQRDGMSGSEHYSALDPDSERTSEGIPI
jgi:hypothetical protein